jgi:peptidyl-prolyl cis-trans isomerase SurA
MIKYLKISLITFVIMFSNGLTVENKIILKIDNEIITTIDVFNEITNLKFFNKNINQFKDEEIYQIAVQSITNYKIKKNEISKNFSNIKFQNEDYLNQIIENTYKELNFKNLEDFKYALSKNQINFENFREKLITDILWNQIIFSKYINNLVVDEEKLKEQIKNTNKKVISLYLKEIVYEVSNVAEISTKYNLIKNDINELGFEGAALKHSISNTSSNGGNLGWIDDQSISNEILNELKKISVKSITEPIRISSGFLILQKFDEKEIEKNFSVEEQLKNLIDYEKNQQLNNYSNLYFNKVKKNIKIYAP